MITFYDWRK